MKNGGNYNSRKSFLKQFFFLLFFGSLSNAFFACKNVTKKIFLKLTGTNHILGHQLWLKNFPKPKETQYYKYIIVGGGVSGLSAARSFIKKGIHDFVILELENSVGGNSNYSSNQYSKFPLAAHYLPLPNLRDQELIEFLKETKIILDFKDNQPIYDEEQICFAQNERLFIKNNWQSGLVPRDGNSKDSNNQIDQFLTKMDEFRKSKGSDNKYFFDIPLSFASRDHSLNYLDDMTMVEWLRNNDFNSKELISYINYCCRDDFGLGVNFISAWAGIYYFASRKKENLNYDDVVFTWPEGNGRLVDHLKNEIPKQNIITNHLVFDIKDNSQQIEVLVYNSKNKTSLLLKAEKVILTTPQYVNKYLVKEKVIFKDLFNYAPWFTATITLSKEFDNQNNPFAWDNVIFEGKGLGYVYNQHQNLEQLVSNKVITYYHSLESENPSKDRKTLYEKSAEFWKQIVINDLKIAHPDIENYIDEIVIHKIGHGMISPKPGFIKSVNLKKMNESINEKIYFAHTDLVGVSIFEEAFHQGINIVNKILNEKPTLDS